MALKINDPCLQKAFDDEPIFVLLARDFGAPMLIMEWVKQSYATQPIEKLMEAIQCARDMVATQRMFHARAHPPFGMLKCEKCDGAGFIKGGDEENLVISYCGVCNGTGTNGYPAKGNVDDLSEKQRAELNSSLSKALPGLQTRADTGKMVDGIMIKLE